MEAAATRASIDEVWSWLAEVVDPEIPVISVVDLGIVRDVRWESDGALVVRITPTYSGCPAGAVIARDIETKLRAKGIRPLRLEQQLSPPWTSDWLSAEGRKRLAAYGIAPPAEAADAARRAGRLLGQEVAIACPRCGSTETRRVSAFGSTPCKAQYQCRSCLEPFDYFRCI